MSFARPIHRLSWKGRDMSSEEHLPQKPTHEVVLVDPFKEIKFRHHRRLLHEHVSAAVTAINAGPESGLRLRFRQKFEFNMADALYGGGKAVENLGQRLQSRLEESQTTLPVIFITHSIGTCIVDSALWGPSNHEYSHQKPAGVVLLDGNLERLSDPNYVWQIARSFGLNHDGTLSKWRILKRLARKQHAHGNNWRAISPELKALSHQETMQNVDLWLDPSTLNAQRTLVSPCTLADAQIDNIADTLTFLMIDQRKSRQIGEPQSVRERVTAYHQLGKADAIKNALMETLLPNITAFSTDTPRTVNPNELSFLDDTEEKALFQTAQSFWAAGELRNAQNLLGERIFKSAMTVPPGLGGYDIRLILQEVSWFRKFVILSDLFLDSGRYEEFEKLLQTLHVSLRYLPQDQKSAYAMKFEKGTAVLYLHQGKYEEAAHILNILLLNPLAKDASTRIQICCSISHVYGLMGQNELAEAHMKELGDGFGTAFTKPLSVLYTEAVLSLLRGEHRKSLEISARTLEKYRRKHGEGNLGTIRVGLLHASLLVHLGEHEKAHPLCRSIMRQTREGLGCSHPLHLESIEILVRSLRSESRLIEALATAKSLVKMATTSLTSMHPLCFRARSQLAATHLAIGNYKSATLECHINSEAADNHFGRGHPDSIRYRAELAQALSDFGHLQGALDQILPALEDQLYWNTGATQRTAQTQALTSSPGSAKKFLEVTVEAVKSGLSTMRHPNILSTLHTLACIRLRMTDGVDDAKAILEVLFYIRTERHGPCHPVTLQTEYDLASTINFLVRPDEEQLQNAHDRFYRVWSARCMVFGPDHPDTLAAEMSVVFSRLQLGYWEMGGPARRSFRVEYRGVVDDDLEDSKLVSLCGIQRRLPNSLKLTLKELRNVYGVSRSIALQQEEKLGPLHPDTMLTKFWLLLMKVHLCEDPSLDVRLIWDSFKVYLSDPTIRQQRLISSLLIEQKAAIEFQYGQHFDVANSILGEMFKTANEQAHHYKKARDDTTNTRGETAIIGHLNAALSAVQNSLKAN